MQLSGNYTVCVGIHFIFSFEKYFNTCGKYLWNFPEMQCSCDFLGNETEAKTMLSFMYKLLFTSPPPSM